MPISHIELKQGPHAVRNTASAEISCRKALDLSRQRAFAVVSALVLLLASIWPALGQGDYLLGPQDKVRLKIYEWRATRDTIFEWTALNDTFSVGVDGSLSLPFAGNVEARGATTRVLAERIGKRLQQRMALGRLPDVSVEIAQFRPFYIVGRVTQPGEYPYRPDLTVLQALSIAGGLKVREDSFARFDREIIAGRGEVYLYQLYREGLLARKARLLAEQADAEEITFPEELIFRQNESSIVELLQQERSIFEVRRKAQETQVQALRELLDFLGKELKSLEGHLEFQDKQIELVQKELTGIASLVKKGFATESRQTGLERAMVEARSNRLTAETALLRARQEISRTELAILELRNKFASDVSTSLRDTEAQLGELDQKTDTASRLLYESEVSAPRLQAERNRASTAQPVFTIVRNLASGIEEIQAGEGSNVRPGDTIKVEIPYSAVSEDAVTRAPDPSGTSALNTVPATLANPDFR